MLFWYGSRLLFVRQRRWVRLTYGETMVEDKLSRDACMRCNCFKIKKDHSQGRTRGSRKKDSAITSGRRLGFRASHLFTFLYSQCQWDMKRWVVQGEGSPNKNKKNGAFRRFNFGGKKRSKCEQVDFNALHHATEQK